MPGLVSDALAWTVVATLLCGTLLTDRRPRAGRALSAVGWVLFGGFWLYLLPYFVFEHKSFVESALLVVAVPLCVYTAWLLYDGRDSLLTLSRAVAVMGLLYLPFETIPAVAVGGVLLPAPKEVLIETVAVQTEFLMNALGYHPEMIRDETGYLNTFRFVHSDGHIIRFSIVLACTGLGSIAIFVGLIAAVRAPLRRKLRALAVAVPVIYALNLLRTTFIGLVFGKQYMQWYVEEVLLLFGASDPYRVSFFLSDRVVSQVLAVFALMGITYLVVRELPELLSIIEDVLYMLTRDEYDLHEALNLPRDPVTDGGRREDRE